AGEIESQLDGYPEKKKDYPARALEALHVTIADYREKVSSGAIPDYAAMPRPASAPQPEPVAAAPSSNGSDSGKVLIKLR
ncbi:MAG: hypothetical protein WAM84_03180, partial [Candidatus Cybelea sp.]